MERDEVWQTIDAERLSLADLLDDLGPAEWETPSLCAGWRVRDVAAHLTLSQLGVLPAAVPGITHLEPLIDILVHGQDITVPLGRTRAMPPRAAAAAASRVWPNLWPFRAERRLRGFRFAATDDDWTAGEGPRIEGPMGAILLLLTGRSAGLSRLTGPGVAELAARLSPAR
jgi:hypothetical protein